MFSAMVHPNMDSFCLPTIMGKWCYTALTPSWESGAILLSLHKNRLATQQKDERRQDNSERRQLARQHPSNLLRSAVNGEQYGVVLTLCFTISNFPHARREAHDADAYT